MPSLRLETFRVLVANEAAALIHDTLTFVSAHCLRPAGPQRYYSTLASAVSAVVLPTFTFLHAPLACVHVVNAPQRLSIYLNC